MQELAEFMSGIMTVKQVAEALGCDDETVRRHVKGMWPSLFQNGKTTYLNQAQVTMVKLSLERSGRNDLRNVAELPSTDLEMLMMDKKVSEWKSKKIEELQLKLQIAAPKVESFDALQRSEKTMSITDAAKHFDLHVKTQVYPYLRAMKYLNQDNTPSQSAIDAGYLAIRQTRCTDGEFRPQACVLASQLETWRVRVVPQIARWIADV